MVKWKLTVVAVAAALMSLLVAAPAAAATDRVTHGNDWGEIRDKIYNDLIIVCDGEDDGRYVWALYLLKVPGGPSQYMAIYDFDGPNNNSCGIADWSGTANYATAIKVCEQDGGCTDPWTYINNGATTGDTKRKTMS